MYPGPLNLDLKLHPLFTFQGVPGLLAVPFCGMAAEKCFYDSLVTPTTRPAALSFRAIKEIFES